MAIKVGLDFGTTTKVGLDFGTTTSEVAIYREATSKVKEELRLLRCDREEVVPSVVLYNGQEVLVGRPALSVAPERVIRSVKRALGQPAENWSAALRALHAECCDLTPVKVASEIFRYLREWAERELGKEVRNAVVGVPAYADLAAQQETRLAAERAGWYVDRLVPEPVAAAVGYLFERPLTDRVQRLLVYDFGGGTFDATLLQFTPPHRYDVFTKFGTPDIGGDNFDRLIVSNVVLPHLDDYFTRAEARGVPRNRIECMAIGEAEAAKKRLSDNISTNFTKDFGEGIGRLELLDALHRTDFEDWIRTDVDASLEKVGDDLGRIGWTFEDVDAALLAGGSSRVPLIQERLRARFGDRLRQTAQLDKVVAKGAALVAAGRYAAEVHDVLARPIGYRVPGQGDQVRRLFNQGIELSEARRTFRWPWNVAARSAKLDFYEGEETTCKGNRYLGRYVLAAPENLPRGTEVEVTIAVPVVPQDSGPLEVTAKVADNGSPLTVTFDRDGRVDAAGSVALGNRPCADLIGVVDTTGSMWHREQKLPPLLVAPWAALAERLERAGVEARFALVTFGEDGRGVSETHWPFTSSRRALVGRLQSLPTNTGGPAEEPVGAALRSALALAQAARPEARTVLLLVTDAEPRDLSEDVMGSLLQGFQSARIYVVILAPGQPRVRAYDTLAAATRGEYFDLYGEVDKAFACVERLLTGGTGHVV